MKIVCLGDSITCNWEDKSYTDYWQALIDRAKLDHQIINAGVNGETAQDGYYRLHRDVISHQPDLLTIMFGHNDADPSRNITPQLYANYLRKIINSFKHYVGTDVWLLSPQQIGDPNYEKQYKGYLDMLKTAAKDKEVKHVDLWQVFDGQDLSKIYTYKMQSTYIRPSGTDWIHPNEKGHQLIAQTLMNKLTGQKT